MARNMAAVRAAIGNQAALVRGSSAARANMAAVRAARWSPNSGKSRPALSAKAAARAFNRFYSVKNPRYRTSRGANIAKSRDLCNSVSPVVNDRRYRRSPNRYNYRGLDDGSRCKRKVSGKRNASAKQLAALAKGRAALARRR